MAPRIAAMTWSARIDRGVGAAGGGRRSGWVAPGPLEWRGRRRSGMGSDTAPGSALTVFGD